MIKKNISQRNAAIIAVLIVAAITAFALLYQQARVFSLKYYSVPEVRGTIHSSSDGREHNVRAKFELKIDESIRPGLRAGELHDRITAIISSLEYDIIAGENGLAYVKEEMKNGLDEYIDLEKLEGIYVWDFITDENINFSNTADNLTQVFEGIFGK